MLPPPSYLNINPSKKKFSLKTNRYNIYIDRAHRLGYKIQVKECLKVWLCLVLLYSHTLFAISDCEPSLASIVTSSKEIEAAYNINYELFLEDERISSHFGRELSSREWAYIYDLSRDERPELNLLAYTKAQTHLPYQDKKRAIKLSTAILKDEKNQLMAGETWDFTNHPIAWHLLIENAAQSSSAASFLIEETARIRGPLRNLFNSFFKKYCSLPTIESHGDFCKNFSPITNLVFIENSANSLHSLYDSEPSLNYFESHAHYLSVDDWSYLLLIATSPHSQVPASAALKLALDKRQGLSYTTLSKLKVFIAEQLRQQTNADDDKIYLNKGQGQESIPWSEILRFYQKHGSFSDLLEIESYDLSVTRKKELSSVLMKKIFGVFFSREAKAAYGIATLTSNGGNRPSFKAASFLWNGHRDTYPQPLDDAKEAEYFLLWAGEFKLIKSEQGDIQFDKVNCYSGTLKSAKEEAATTNRKNIVAENPAEEIKNFLQQLPLSSRTKSFSVSSFQKDPHHLLEELNQDLKGNFRHDWNNVLTVIVGGISMFEIDDKNEPFIIPPEKWDQLTYFLDVIGAAHPELKGHLLSMKAKASYFKDLTNQEKDDIIMANKFSDELLALKPFCSIFYGL